MKYLKKISLLLLVLMMLVPTFTFAQEMNLEAIKEQIKETIDYSDSELYGFKYSDRSVRTVADFAIYHRKEAKLSMADDAFNKDLSKVVDKGDRYEITLYTKPVSKEILGKVYEADCTGITPVIDGEEIAVEAFGSKKAVHNKNKNVPEGFKFTILKDDLEEEKVGEYNKYFKIKFTTNLADSGFLGKIGAAMMNPNARFFVK
ncbi:hypothetical protein [Peptoniphilus sp. Marseille-Q6390]